MKTNASMRFLLVCGLLVPCPGMLRAQLRFEPTGSSHCMTQTCTEYTKYVIKFMSTAADPCVNFGEYVCSPHRKFGFGRNLSQHPGSYTERWLNVQKEIMRILQESRSANFSEGNEAAIAYQCCINENSSYELDNLRVLLKDRGEPDWPMTEDLQEKYHIVDFTDPSVLEAFFHFEAVQDTSDPTKYMLLVTQPSFPVVHPGVLSNLRLSREQETKMSVKSNGKFRDMEESDKPSDAEALEAVVDRRRRTEFNSNNPETAGETLRSREALITEAYQTYVEEVIKTMRNVPSLESMEISKEIVHFESHLAKFAEASSKAEDNSPIHSSLRRLIDQYPSVSSPGTLLRKYLERNGITIDDGINVYIAEPKYFELVFALLKTARRYQVKNYQGWKIIASLAPFVAPLRLQHQEFVRFYELPKKDKEEICAEAIAGKGSPLEALVYMAYVERKFPLKAKEDVRQMVAFIQEEMEATLLRSKWSRSPERDQALTKVKNLAKQIGYPAWIDNKEHLLHLFNKMGDISTGSSFIRVLEDYRVANFENSMKKLNSRFSYENEWSGTPLDVTFGYDASSNLMYLPAGFLQPLIYSVDLPAAVNYGTVGLMVAQEMLRAFLKGSSDYGFDTSSRACPRETLKMYIERTYFFPGALPKSISSEFLLENNEELHEDNYVDKKAIEVAWKAFLKHTKKTISKTNTLALGKNATREKLFFISVGLSLCLKEPYYSVETQIEESYSKESRLNKFVKNMPPFREAFGCEAKH